MADLLLIGSEWDGRLSKPKHYTYLSLELPIVVNECAEFQRQLHLLDEVLRRGILVERLLDLDELGGPVDHHVTLVGRGEKVVPGGGAPEGSVLWTVRLQWKGVRVGGGCNGV